MCQNCKILNTIKILIKKHGLKPYSHNALKYLEEHYKCMNNMDFIKFINTALSKSYLKHSEFRIINTPPRPQKTNQKHPFSANFIPEINALYIKIREYSLPDNIENFKKDPVIMNNIKETDKIINAHYDLCSSVIIDVFNNLGGTSHSMLYALRKIYGTCRAEIGVGNMKKYWIIKNGLWKSVSETEYYKTPFRSGKPVIVIFNNKTASAGEFCVLPLYGVKNTVFISNTKQSYGLISDTVSFYIDKNGNYTKKYEKNSKYELTLMISHTRFKNHILKNDALTADIVVENPFEKALHVAKTIHTGSIV